MAAIFAIIAIYSQDIFAIVAISFFAKIANTNSMNDLELEHKRWLARQLQGVSRGEKGKIAEYAGIDGTKLSRMANTDPKADPKNTQKIPATVLHLLTKYFKNDPPGLPREESTPPERRSRENIRVVPILDRVSAGKLKAPISQIPERDRKWISLSGLGSGDFIGFHLDHDADSIDRVAPPGSIIIVDRADSKPTPGNFYVFSLEGEVTTKQWQPGPPPYLAPFSWNPIHKPQFIKRKRDLEVIGRVRRAVVDL